MIDFDCLSLCLRKPRQYLASLPTLVYVRILALCSRPVRQRTFLTKTAQSGEKNSAARLGSVFTRLTRYRLALHLLPQPWKSSLSVPFGKSPNNPQPAVTPTGLRTLITLNVRRVPFSYFGFFLLLSLFLFPFLSLSFVFYLSVDESVLPAPAGSQDRTGQERSSGIKWFLRSRYPLR